MSKGSTESNQKLFIASMSILAITVMGCLFTMIFLFADEPEIREVKAEQKRSSGAADSITKIAEGLKTNIALNKEMSEFEFENASSLQEFLMVQRKSQDYTEILRYVRTETALRKCGADYADLHDHYTRTNKPRYEKLLKKQEAINEQRIVDISKSSKELQSIETSADLLKMQLSGGAVQHVSNSMNLMQSMSEMDGEYRGGYSKDGCLFVRQQIQRGKLDLRR